MGRSHLGEFEQLVLLACMRLGNEAYTVSILREIESRAGRRTSHAAVYVALRRLGERGLVDSHMGEPTPERGGRPKRYFSVRPEAVAALVEARDALLNMWQGLEGDPRVQGAGQ